MAIKHFFLIVFLGLLFGCNAQPTGNELANESSAYLKLHAKNPVFWKPWGNEAMKKAADEDKLVIISIGYVSCHWCHVMEEESFSDKSTADKMNEHFISVKVDREERPDVDKAYMNAAYIINGSGGWPLNVVALPDGRPVWAGTYLTIAKWNELLDFFIKIKAESPEKLETQARSLQAGLNQIEGYQFTESKIPVSETLKRSSEVAKKEKDPQYGGQQGAPKFPIPVTLEFQLQHGIASGDQEMIDHVLFTLNKILEGGIYDHLAGGFFRYSTDKYWKVPHFEKMLYDNGQLIKLYSNAIKLTKDEKYKKAIVESIAFFEDEMRHENGLFFASVDADSEGEEGKFYIWEDFKEVDLAKKDLLEDHFGIDMERELDEKNVLYIANSADVLANRYKMGADEVTKLLNEDKLKLKQHRAKRIQPFHDDKVISSWNAMMVIGYLNAWEAIGNEDYLTAAKKTLDALIANHVENGKVTHLASDKKYYLEDAVFVSQALIKMYENTFDITLLDLSKQIMEEALKTFEDPNSEFYFYSSPENGSLVVNVHEITDNVIPGSNSQLAINLYQLGHYYYDTAFINKAERMLAFRLDDLSENPLAHANWGLLASWVDQGLFEVALTGEKCLENKYTLSKTYIPNALFLGSANEENLVLLENKLVEGKSLIYVCQNKTCKFPVADPTKALGLMK